MIAPLSLKTRAFIYLARREHSRLELEKKLAPHAKNFEELSFALDSFEQQGFLSDNRVVEQVICVRRKKFGGRRIVQELRQKGIDENLITAALKNLKETELQTAREVWQKKFGAMPIDAKERGKQIRFLMSRGFESEIIGRVLLSPYE